MHTIFHVVHKEELGTYFQYKVILRNALTKLLMLEPSNRECQNMAMFQWGQEVTYIVFLNKTDTTGHLLNVVGCVIQPSLQILQSFLFFCTGGSCVILLQ